MFIISPTASPLTTLFVSEEKCFEKVEETYFLGTAIESKIEASAEACEARCGSEAACVGYEFYISSKDCTTFSKITNSQNNFLGITSGKVTTCSGEKYTTFSEDFFADYRDKQTGGNI